MRIALFGPPGAGKGTQADLLVQRHGLTHISTGVIIRAAMKAGTPVGREARSYVDSGRLVPDDVVRALAEEAIADVQYDDFILDGYPRTVQQATWLSDFLAQHEARLTAVLSLQVPDDTIIERLSKRRVNKVTGENYHLDFKPPPPDIDPAVVIQRPDDQPAAIQKRLEVYRAETHPVEAYYRERGQLVEVDGVGSFETVLERLEAALAAPQQPR